MTKFFLLRIGTGGTVSTTSSFSNQTPIIIPAVGAGDSAGAPATPYPSTINVSGVSGTISKATAQLFGINHTRTDDIDVLLVGPGGRKLLLMSDAGFASVFNVSLTFDDAAPALLGFPPSPARSCQRTIMA